MAVVRSSLPVVVSSSGRIVWQGGGLLVLLLPSVAHWQETSRGLEPVRGCANATDLQCLYLTAEACDAGGQDAARLLWERTLVGLPACRGMLVLDDKLTPLHPPQVGTSKFGYQTAWN
jgi:hypothetical protein